MQRFSLITLGCKVNQYDGNALATRLCRAGWRRVVPGEPADLLVILTCCVTSVAMRKSRQVIRQCFRRSQGAKVLVAGCYSDYDSQAIQRLLDALEIPSGKAVIAGHHEGLVRGLEQLLHRPSPTANPTREPADRRNEECINPGDITSGVTVSNPSSIKERRDLAVKANVPAERLKRIDRFEGHQRAFVKIQDGCDAFCSYCVVPFTRCHVWSRDADEVEAECRDLVAAGHKEIVLSGVFLGAFGRDTAIRRKWNPATPSQLPQLLRRIAGIDGLWRVRLSSLEPGDLTDELLEVYGDTPAVAPHFHLPLQSGSQRILSRMNRQYTAEDFRETAERVRSTLDRPAITTDIIVGFPGETEEDFSATLELARHAGFAKIHAFPFSAIEPTAAWYWRKDCPSPQTVRERMGRLAATEVELAENYRKQFLAETMEALVEGPRRSGRHQAMTDRYVRVFFDPPDSHPRLTGQVIPIHITQTCSDGVRGVMAGREASPRPQ